MTNAPRFDWSSRRITSRIDHDHVEQSHLINVACSVLEEGSDNASTLYFSYTGAVNETWTQFTKSIVNRIIVQTYGLRRFAKKWDQAQ